MADFVEKGPFIEFVGQQGLLAEILDPMACKTGENEMPLLWVVLESSHDVANCLLILISSWSIFHYVHVTRPSIGYSILLAR